ncbi:hypothetical protein O0I10_006017 [Lichtheimia ornata]|uniref:MADS-box domain-containing protein n=1 Tax=Lichtheimia ornata TaxID=688661 RepID=A0AAD7V3R8_9FUNG|nr:uncharacterized protein O0I10_006017 [Lichtheimia ornata]KAJ8658334.1 hypothetical protein O0I10_006017 [Lichtheimia ornata]
MNNLGSLQQPTGLGQHQMPRQQQPFQQSTGPGALAANDRPIINQNNIEDDSDSESKPEKRSGRRKIKIEFIEDKSRRHITFSKRKAGIMKKAYELSTLTGTQVLLLVVSETGLVYTFTTPKLQPLVTKPEGKNLIQACLNAPDPVAEGPSSSPQSVHSNHTTQSNTGATNAAVGKSVHGNPYPQDATPGDIYGQADRKPRPAPYGSVPMTSYPGYDTAYQQATSQPTYNGTPTGYAHHPPQPNYYGSNHPYMPSPTQQQPYWPQKK